MSPQPSQLRYHVLTARRSHGRGFGPSSHGNPLGGAIELAPVVLEMLNRGLLGLRLKGYLKALEPSIAHVLPQGGGVLVVYTTQWWEDPDLGTRIENIFEPPSIAGVGPSAMAVHARWNMRPHLTQAPPPGWNLSRHFLWTTR